MENRIVKRYSLSKQVADKLEEMIANGEYKVGCKINTETELMQMFQVSRNTLREAIQSLQSAGILDVKQGDGTYVRSNNRFNANMSKEFEKASPDEIAEARDALEITISHLAAERRTEDDLDIILLALRNRQGSGSAIKENTKADMEFHMAIAKASHNRILYDLYASINSFLESNIEEKLRSADLDYAEVDRLHEELYLAIRDGSAERAQVCAHNILSI